jgi:hypothetical protein
MDRAHSPGVKPWARRQASTTRTLGAVFPEAFAVAPPTAAGVRLSGQLLQPQSSARWPLPLSCDRLVRMDDEYLVAGERSSRGGHGDRTGRRPGRNNDTEVR